MTNRIESLANLTGGKVEWYATHKQITQAEMAVNLVWDGNEHKPAPEGKIVRASTGSYGRQAGNRSYALTGAECDKLGLTRGPAND